MNCESGLVPLRVLWDHTALRYTTVRRAFGRYTLAFRYSLGSGGDRPMNLMLNGQLVQVYFSAAMYYSTTVARTPS
jgi:hypothetical protein